MASRRTSPLKTARRSALPPLASAFRSVVTYASMAPGGARLLRKQQTFLASMAGRTTNALPEFWARRRSSPLRAVAREAYAPDLDRRRRATTQISREASNATAQNT